MSQLVRDKIEAVARLWYASEPDKGLRERLTEGLIDKMTAAMLPALVEASQRSEMGTRERLHHIWCKSLLKMDLPCNCGFPEVEVGHLAGTDTPAPRDVLLKEALEGWREWHSGYNHVDIPDCTVCNRLGEIEDLLESGRAGEPEQAK